MAREFAASAACREPASGSSRADRIAWMQRETSRTAWSG